MDVTTINQVLLVDFKKIINKLLLIVKIFCQIKTFIIYDLVYLTMGILMIYQD
jgi:hypothetical protein